MALKDNLEKQMALKHKHFIIPVQMLTTPSYKVQISHPWAQTIVKCHAGYLR